MRYSLRFLSIVTEMSSDSQPIIDLTSDSEDALSSSTAVVAPVVPVPDSSPDSSLIASDAETEPFEEGEVTPTPPMSPIPSVVLTPIVSSPPTVTTYVGPNPSRRVKSSSGYSRTRQTARKRVRSFTITPLDTPTTQISPPPVVAHVPSSDVPPKKRARLDTSGSHTSQDTLPPAHYCIGESSRAAAFRGPTTFSLYAQVTDQQGQIDRMRLQIDRIVRDRLEGMDEEIENLIQGRVSIDVSYQGLETRQLQDHDSITELRGELPELFARAQTSHEEHQRQAGELATIQTRLTASETREADLQLRIQHLEEIVVMLNREIRRLRDGSGGSGGAPGGA